ncbi:acyl-CoA thioesterase [Calidifontibacillus erzurumensis]|uniref:Acyl-CoA thioesterase n=1 Tax=Calidifontibacillus erzurumensis TaxID=2741433 RepID=A0A8J8GEI6_9BACI|nr:acyl-CoA thioesterase [Calidifontibacillus erzurumensis]NSL52414.1 acyl-CoA thioesterase [Calidifontibacillus erzurumensis]
MIEKKSANESRTYQTKLVLPSDANHMGTIFGGTVLAYIDEIAGITAMRHSKSAVVTASIDTVNFVSSAKVGDILFLEASVISTGRTSMEIFVKVETEHLETGERTLTTTSILTMVAVDENKKPIPVPGVIPETEEEKRLFSEAEKRRKQRLSING